MNDAGDRDYSGTSFTGGIQAGYNWQHDNLVFGLEADIGYLGVDASAKDGAVYPCCRGDFEIKQDLSADWLGTARAKLGFGIDQVLLYGTGGLAFGNVDYNSHFSDSYGASASSSNSEVKLGWTVGGGFEWMMHESASLKLEYLYYDLGDVSSNSGALAVNGGTSADTKFHNDASVNGSIVRVGLNWHVN